MTTIRNVSYEDLDAIVSIHKSAFKNFFLTELGSKFLKLYYRSVLKSKQSILIGAYNDGTLVRFCAACRKSAGFNSSLISENLLDFVTTGFTLILTRPLSVLRLIMNLTKTGEHDDNGEYAELMSIGVFKTTQIPEPVNFCLHIWKMI